MHVYYIDEPPTGEELVDLAEMLESEVELVRIPWLIPEGEPGESLEATLAAREDVAARLLKRAGVISDYGRQTGFVIPCDMMSYGAFTDAFYKLTGYYPYAIQTAAHRRSIGNEGYLRVFDMHGMMTGHSPG